MQRRVFIKNAAFTTGSMLLSKMDLLAYNAEQVQQLTILHTNDVHSRIVARKAACAPSRSTLRLITAGILSST